MGPVTTGWVSPTPVFLSGSGAEFAIAPFEVNISTATMTTVTTYYVWFEEVKQALASINMPTDEWQNQWVFDFRREFESGAEANVAAIKANRFWWHQQNIAMNRDCPRTANCCLPNNHQGDCQPRF